MSEDKAYESIFIARQPVFDSSNETWGYLMLFRDSDDADHTIFSDNSEATMNLVANLPLYGGIGGDKARIMIHFTPEDILRGTQHAILWANTVIILEEETNLDDALLNAVRELKDGHYEIAINNFEGKPGSEPLAELADMFIVDIADKGDPELTQITTMAQKYGAPLMMAKRVENADDLARAKKFGFNIFHGFFFKQPHTESSRKITSSESTRLKLFDIIEKEEPDFDALAPAIEGDVSISYRLLNFLNSANFSFASKVTSIRQAVVLAGWKPIRTWLHLIILTDMTPSEKSQELAYLSALRAKLFEMAALGGGYENESDKLFMLGLFSMLEAMLDTEMKDIVDHLPVDKEIKAALCGKPNQYFHWISLASAIEQSDWEEVGVTAKGLGLLPGTVAASYQHALSWVDAFFTNGPK